MKQCGCGALLSQDAPRSMCTPCRGRYNEAWYRAITVVGKQCHWCDQPATERDHLIPMSRGGAHHPTNIVPSCKACNAGRR